MIRRTPKELALDISTNTKECTTCRLRKPMGLFHKKAMSPDGVASTCISCYKKGYNKTSLIRRTPEQILNDISSKTKVCTSCKTRRAFEDYHKNSKSPDGHKEVCKKCKQKVDKALSKLPAVKLFRREAHLNNKYGITTEDYLKLYKKVDGRCEICGRFEEMLCVDHNHATGGVRGLLCNSCNAGIGHLQDSQVVLTKAVSYLDQRGSYGDATNYKG